MSAAQCNLTSTSANVTTWHNDNCRTGWQQSESTLNQTNVTVVNNSFGLLYQWNQVAGHILAQPLAAGFPYNVGSCQGSQTSPCNLVFAATEEDMLYAFNTSPSAFSQTPVWSVNLATQVGGTPVDCSGIDYSHVFYACINTDPVTGEPGPFTAAYIGVTGTPVIDVNATPDPVLYVVGAVCVPNCSGYEAATGYYLFAVDILTQAVTSTEISGTVPGNAPQTVCTSTYPSSGNIYFSSEAIPNAHIQRSALLLPTSGGPVYVAFADLPERNNGWMFGYQLQGRPGSGSLNQTAIFASTPYGTGGGFWGAGAGPASDGTYIYTATANGTLFDANNASTIPLDTGDALIKLLPGNGYPGGLGVVDWWVPGNVLNYQGILDNGQTCAGTGLCDCDKDLSSGGVLLVPAPYQYKGINVVINADKQSNIYVANQQKLGGYQPGPASGCPSTPNNIECIQTPPVNKSSDPTQGYWASPAYWYDQPESIYWLYYSATMKTNASGVSPQALNAYQLQTTGNAGPITSPIPPYTSSPILFCDLSPTPSLSSNGSGSASAGTGIVWAIEQNQNKDNQGSGQQDCYPGQNNSNQIPHAALHAFCATGGAPGTACANGPLTEIYSSRPISSGNAPSPAGGFPTPTVFNGQVYVRTNKELNVFGLCSTYSQGCKK